MKFFTALFLSSCLLSIAIAHDPRRADCLGDPEKCELSDFVIPTGNNEPIVCGTEKCVDASDPWCTQTEVDNGNAKSLSDNELHCDDEVNIMHICGGRLPHEKSVNCDKLNAHYFVVNPAANAAQCPDFDTDAECGAASTIAAGGQDTDGPVDCCVDKTADLKAACEKFKNAKICIVGGVPFWLTISGSAVLLAVVIYLLASGTCARGVASVRARARGFQSPLKQREMDSFGSGAHGSGRTKRFAKNDGDLRL